MPFIPRYGGMKKTGWIANRLLGERKEEQERELEMQRTGKTKSADYGSRTICSGCETSEIRKRKGIEGSDIYSKYRYCTSE